MLTTYLCLAMARIGSQVQQGRPKQQVHSAILWGEPDGYGYRVANAVGWHKLYISQGSGEKPTIQSGAGVAGREPLSFAI
ncbi:MAG: hypothetical protein F6K30_12940 [Cyanothece sp. SIO2G6]|nr:hypothetical protein [Cyanothece sp. SIO2G6]